MENSFKIIKHSQFNECVDCNTKKENRRLRRRATAVAELKNGKVYVNLSICNPLDNFVKSDGIQNALDNGPLFAMVVPNGLNAEEFTKHAANSIIKRFDRSHKHQSILIQRLIALKAN